MTAIVTIYSIVIIIFNMTAIVTIYSIVIIIFNITAIVTIYSIVIIIGDLSNYIDNSLGWGRTFAWGGKSQVPLLSL